jgi:hypothetical protein
VTGHRIRIGGASGFWGDSGIAAPQLVKGGALDYLVFDYLAEITMSIMARARAKDARRGYALDFVDRTLREILVDCARQGVRILSNAGGVNPLACGEAIETLVAELGLDLKVAVVTGDDLLDRAASLADVREMFSGEPFPAAPVSINAYLGATPVAAALDRGADIVITGRCADSALVLGACLHAFGWAHDDYDRLAGGSLAGHILECGAQATGGLFTDWEQVPGWDDIGYPIAEIDDHGDFIVSKPPGTGGLVSVGTVCEQLLYEIGDPQAYLLPDVICDFSQVRVAQLADDMVSVSGASGRAPSGCYKVSATWQDGYRLGLTQTIVGIDADRKAKRVGEAVVSRVERMLAARGLPQLSAISVEVLGAEAEYGPHARVEGPREVVLKIAAKHPQSSALDLLLREATSTGTSMSPGITGMGGNRPKVAPVVRLFSFLAAAGDIPVRVHMAGEAVDVAPPIGGDGAGPPFESSRVEEPVDLADTISIPLVRLAWGRSGDKGDNANIGVIARRADYLPWIRRALSEETVARRFAHLCEGEVTRFDVPGIQGLNFLLTRALGGGGIASLRNDPQGKGYAQILLDQPVRISRAIAVRDGLI